MSAGVFHHIMDYKFLDFLRGSFLKSVFVGSGEIGTRRWTLGSHKILSATSVLNFWPGKNSEPRLKP